MQTQYRTARIYSQAKRKAVARRADLAIDEILGQLGEAWHVYVIAGDYDSADQISARFHQASEAAKAIRGARL